MTKPVKHRQEIGMQGEDREGTVAIKGQQERSPWIELFCITTVGGDSRVNSCVRTLTDTQSKTGEIWVTQRNVPRPTPGLALCARRCHWGHQGDGCTGSTAPHTCSSHLRAGLCTPQSELSLRKLSVRFYNTHTHTNKEQACLPKHSARINLGSKTVFNRNKSQ